MKLTMRGCKIYLENDISSVELPFMRPADFDGDKNLTDDETRVIMKQALRNINFTKRGAVWQQLRQF